MTPECRKCAFKEARQQLLGTFPQQQIGLWKPKRCCEINTSMSMDKQQTFSIDTARLYKSHVEKNDSFVHESFFVRHSSLVTRKSLVEEVTDLQIRNKSVTTEKKTIIVQYGMQRFLGSH
jgi:hypothetical protein